MSDRSGINIEGLLNCGEDEDNENERLKEFYERNLPFLKEYPAETVLARIARKIHKTLLNKKVDWMEYAETLGITDVDLLDKIEERAERPDDGQPLFIIFTKVLPRTKGFDHIIRMLIKHNRFDILRIICSDAKGIIEKSRETKVKGHLMIEPEYGSEQLTSTACSIYELDSETSSDSNCCKLNTNTSIQNPPSYIIRKEFDDSQQSSINDSCRTEIILDSTVCHKNLKQNLPSERDIVPSAPPVQENPEEKISVFIQHTKLDTDYAVQLYSKFKNAGFKVKTMSDMDVILAINDTEALSAIFQEVDFIVPVISESFLKQIHATGIQFDDAANNKYFYQLIMQDYKNNCYNYKVRPVILPGMVKQKLKKDIVLSFPFRFGVEDDKLIRVLKETKNLIPRNRLQKING